MSPSNRPTIHDVARLANVSLATVDRVLNQRPGVRLVTAERVAMAVRQLGYVRDVGAANLARQRSYPLLFILPEGSNAFMRGLEQQVRQLQAHASSERVSLHIQLVPPLDSSALVAALRAVDPARFAGVALVATDSAPVIAAMNALVAQGVPVVTLVSDVPQSRRSHYAGINNVAAGRTAASLLGRFLHGQGGVVAVLAGSMLLRDHVERHLGFMQVMQAEFPALTVLPVLEGRDESGTVARLMAACLQAQPTLCGVYSLGAGNRGLISALQQAGKAGQVKVVAHELTDYARDALLDGTFDVVLNQDAGHEVRSAVRVLKAQLDGQPVLEAQERIRIDVFLRDNMPDVYNG